jgi:hypothetical protein
MIIVQPDIYHALFTIHKKHPVVHAWLANSRLQWRFIAGKMIERCLTSPQPGGSGRPLIAAMKKAIRASGKLPRSSPERRRKNAPFVESGPGKK